MNLDWESRFVNWAQSPGKTEEEKCSNALKVVKNAVSKSDKLMARSVDVFVKGSYRNRTNVRIQSDVDVVVRCTDALFLDLPAGLRKEDCGFTGSSYPYQEFRNDVLEALRNYLGKDAASPGTNAIDVHQTTYHVDADVIPCFAYRKYLTRKHYHDGVGFQNTLGKLIRNWPEQNYSSGVRKNNQTKRRFKKIVRILKAINSQASLGAPSFFIESLVWNLAPSRFGHSTLTEDVNDVLGAIYREFASTPYSGNGAAWTEPNQIKPLFSHEQKWQEKDARKFAEDVWSYLN